MVEDTVPVCLNGFTTRIILAVEGSHLDIFSRDLAFGLAVQPVEGGQLSPLSIQLCLLL